MLLVFDNVEHLLESVDILSELLSHAPRVKVLVTSLERLHLQEEQLFPLQGLQMPAQMEIETSEVFETSEVSAAFDAIKLFSQRARHVEPRFDLRLSKPGWFASANWLTGCRWVSSWRPPGCV